MRRDCAAVTDGRVVAYTYLLREGPVEKYIMSYVDALADTDAAPSVHGGTPTFEWNEERQSGQTEAPQLDESVFDFPQWMVQSMVFKYFSARHRLFFYYGETLVVVHQRYLVD